ncbi:g6735 [Coccomyxa viridis]|uniref:G6735 protein n=1 Tax=Coccomyxa viridis TaxID=1274662 RepID=A0ABP1FYM0_9CHLO
MLDDSLLGLPSYISATIVEHLSARDLCTLAQASRGCWELAGLCAEVEVVFQAQRLGKQSASLRQFLRRHGSRVSKLSMTLRGTKPALESVEGLAVQAEALQHLAAVVLACAQHLKVAYPLKAPTAVLHLRGIYYSCIVELGNNMGTLCFGPLKNCFHTYLLGSDMAACAGGSAALHRSAVLDLLTHNSWKVDGPCPLKAHENIITHFCKQLPNLKVLRWRETSNMVAALDELQDASEFSEAYCASLADSSAPGCQLMEVFNSHGIFLPQLADEAGLSGPKTLAIKQSSGAEAGILPAKGLAQNLLGAPLLQELRLCTLHLLHPGALRFALAKLCQLRVLVLDYVEAYEKNSACVDTFSTEPCVMPKLEVLMLSKDALQHLKFLRCPKVVAFSGELESSTQVLTLQQHLPACGPSLRHMLLAANVSMSGLESAISAFGPVISSCSQLHSFNICLQECSPQSSGAPENKQVAMPMMVPGQHNLSHIAVTCALPLAKRTSDPRLQLAKSLAGELVTWQNCQLWPHLPNLNQVSNARPK